MSMHHEVSTLYLGKRIFKYFISARGGVDIPELKANAIGLLMLHESLYGMASA